MPSLRRTFSSPFLRPSPYTTSSSSNTNQATRQGGHGPRRSLGSETGGRRVLADIDWWTVHAGQIFTADYAPPPQLQDEEEDPQTEQEIPANVVDSTDPVAMDEPIAPSTVWHTTLPGSGAGAFMEDELVQVPYAFGTAFDEVCPP